MIGAPLHSGRLRFLALLFVAGWAICVYRLTDIQLIRSASYHDRARRQHFQEQVLQPRRGEILDREGRLLAVDRLLHTVGVHPKYVTDAAAVARELTSLVGGADEQWLAEIANHQGYFHVVRQAYLLEEPPPAHELPGGLEITEAYRRTYPRRRTASSVLGYTGIDGTGLEGLELDYDDVLNGQAGRVVQQVDALGASIPGREAVREEPVSGMDLRLTLDSVIQEVLEEELARGVDESEAAAGIAVALDPETGAILAMAQWPTFDLNDPDDVDPSQRRNRAITDPFEPGSVLKIVTFTAALDAGRYTPADTIDGGNGVIQVVGSEIRDEHSHGRMSLGEVLQYSSNVGTVKIARHVGENRLYRYARDFGFGQVTGLGLPGEASGLLRKLSDWYGPALESLSIGYGISVTALQIAAAYAAVANGGRLLQPWLVDAVRDEKGRWHSVGGVQVVRRVMHAETSLLLRGFLRDAVAGGTGKQARVPGLQIAGKTGTARKAGPSGYEAGRYISSFCGFLPADDPKFLLLVIVDEPANRYYASEVAAPIFAKTVQRLICHPQNPLRGFQSSIHQVVERPAPVVPDLRSWPAAEAGKALNQRGFRMRFVGNGPRVLSQEPEPLSQVEEGVVVVLHLEAPGTPESASQVIIPDLKGRSLREAAAAASTLGLLLSVEGNGLVLNQNPRAGTRVNRGTSLRVVAGIGSRSGR